MTGMEFAEFIKELRYSYDLRLPDREISDFWFKRLQHIPAEALEWIRDRIFRDHPDRFPKRFDALIASLWREWLQAHHEKREPGSICPECDHGFVTVMETEPSLYGDQLISVAYACGRCRASMRGSAKLTKSEARKRGLNLIDARAPFHVQTRMAEDPRTAVDELAGRMAFS